MKTIKPPNKKGATYRFSCRGCGAVLEAEPNDGRLVGDQRDGDAYVFRCPHCAAEAWISVR